MITKLPVALPALADEPGFSLLARNAHANASATTQEFCTAVGLSKARICSGHPAELVQLASLTGSGFDAVEHSSPRVSDRKLTFLGNRTFLSRSLRKAKQLICPVCWQEDLECSGTEFYVRQQWLPEPIHTCLKHSSALIPLPFIDYTSCYDHIMRAKHDVRWLRQLELLQTDQTPTTFEVTAIKSLTDKQSVCRWLGDPQIDALERWSIGLGMLIQNRQGRPEDLSTEERRFLAATGFDITIQGRTQLDTDIDAALGLYQIRLGKTWLHSWAFQSAQSPERQIFRQLMKDICGNQGRFSLINVCQVSADEHFVNCEIANIARSTNRSKFIYHPTKPAAMSRS